MKLKPEHMLYVRSMGKALRVVAIFTSADESNRYMETHRDTGCVAEFGPYIFLANLHDHGITIPKEEA